MAEKEHAGKGEHHPAGRSERPIPFKILSSQRAAYDALPEDVRKAVEDLYPHFDKIAVRLQTSGYNPPEPMLRQVVNCLDRRLKPVREYLHGPESDTEVALRSLPEPIAQFIRESRGGIALQAQLLQQLEGYPEAEHADLRRRIFAALGMQTHD